MRRLGTASDRSVDEITLPKVPHGPGPGSVEPAQDTEVGSLQTIRLEVFQTLATYCGANWTVGDLIDATLRISEAIQSGRTPALAESKAVAR